MGLVMTTEGVFQGIKTGNKKNSTTGEVWLALQFKVPEYYKGVTIAAEGLSLPNLVIFPQDNFDHSTLTPNQKYRLDLDISARKGNNGFAQIDAKILKVHGRPQ